MAQDVIDLGNSMIATKDEMVINWKGTNYYKSCDEPVFRHGGGKISHCTKRLGHPSLNHEDWEGHVTTTGAMI